MLQQLTRPIDTRKRQTVRSVAKALNCSYARIRRLLKLMKDGNHPDNINWVRGRPMKKISLTEEQLAWITSRQTLRLQCGKPLRARLNILNQKYDSHLSIYDLRKIYRLYGITMQKLRSQLKPPKYMDPKD